VSKTIVKKRVGSTFVFPPELGELLRALRRRSGLGVDELAHLMDRRPGFSKHLSRLERGQVRYPSLALLADYLRACRASFSEVLPLLDRYTNRLPVRETRARETALSGLVGDRSREAVRLGIYDLKTEAARKRAGQKPLPPQKRARAVSRQLASRRQYRTLDRAVLDELNRPGVEPKLVVRELARDYGRMVWKALVLTEAGSKEKAVPEARGAKRGRSPGRPRKPRKQRLAEVETRMREMAGRALPLKSLRRIAERVKRLYAETHRGGAGVAE